MVNFEDAIVLRNPGLTSICLAGTADALKIPCTNWDNLTELGLFCHTDESGNGGLGQNGPSPSGNPFLAPPSPPLDRPF
ncbi:hypothetical protein C8F01DRAFT_1245595 [Mycena amicta]|nr:hypothetical protein C8F01DRAFT_1245595 [Mycena amicta]